MTESTSIVNTAPAAPVAAPPPPIRLTRKRRGDGRGRRAGARADVREIVGCAVPSDRARRSRGSAAGAQLRRRSSRPSRAAKRRATSTPTRSCSTSPRRSARLPICASSSKRQRRRSMPTKWLLRVSVDAPGKTSAPIDLTFGDAIAAHRSVTGSVARE